MQPAARQKLGAVHQHPQPVGRREVRAAFCWHALEVPAMQGQLFLQLRDQLSQAFTFRSETGHVRWGC